MRIEKELDLQKALHRLRALVFTALGSLTTQELVCVDHMSQIVVNENTSGGESTDEELAEGMKRDEL